MIRGKPIISMLEEIGCNLMAKMNNSRNYMEKYSGPITHVAQSKLEKVKKIVTFGCQCGQEILKDQSSRCNTS